MQQRTGVEQPRYPADFAFVVQFQVKSAGDRRVGRIEHLASGRAERFDSTDQLWNFVSAVLAELESSEVPGGEEGGSRTKDTPR